MAWTLLGPPRHRGRFPMSSGAKYSYGRLPTYEERSDSYPSARKKTLGFRPKVVAMMFVFALAFLLLLVGSRRSAALPQNSTKKCDTVNHGYQCSPETSHFWGQYSPYFSVPSDIDDSVPDKCEITFAQVLSRHGARDPTLSKTLVYQILVANLKNNVKSFSGPYAFLENYEYTLGADQLTSFGQQTMWNSGEKFFERYKDLVKSSEKVFVRSAGQDRVVESGQNFTLGFNSAAEKASGGNGSGEKDEYKTVDPEDILIIPEGSSFNNTLSIEICPAYESGKFSSIRSGAEKAWVSVFVPPIQKRLNNDLKGANLSESDTISLMELCPFNTIADPNGKISPFCSLFSEDEWKQYDYYQSVSKYYGYSHGNPIGPTQGVGFVNELIARLTHKPVDDHTSTNRTLDADEKTFPIGEKQALFADFSHDNDMLTIYSALGLYNSTAPLSNSTIQKAEESGGFSASWLVPFGARLYVEKMDCEDNDDELVRVLVNDRVLDLQQCGGDKLGRCSLTKFVDSLAFARSGGRWNEC